MINIVLLVKILIKTLCHDYIKIKQEEKKFSRKRRRIWCFYKCFLGFYLHLSVISIINL